jgi:hypothetical protein
MPPPLASRAVPPCPPHCRPTSRRARLRERSLLTHPWEAAGLSTPALVHALNAGRAVADVRRFIGRVYRGASRTRVLAAVGQNPKHQRKKRSLLGYMGFGQSSANCLGDLLGAPDPQARRRADGSATKTPGAPSSLQLSASVGATAPPARSSARSAKARSVGMLYFGRLAPLGRLQPVPQVRWGLIRAWCWWTHRSHHPTSHPATHDVCDQALQLAVVTSDFVAAAA